MEAIMLAFGVFFLVNVQVLDGSANTCFKLPDFDVENLMKMSCKDLIDQI